MEPLVVVCDMDHDLVVIDPEEFVHDDGGGIRTSWRCVSCGSSVKMREDTAAAVLGPIRAAGMDRVPVSLLVKAVARLKHGV